jgi:SNF2 family DNA or RNA helicase
VGLGWLQGLQRLGLGGVLADDMGLGKTVQVLALLEARRQAGAGPSLVVVPRSLVHNWVEEATRLAPAMRVHVHHGTRRAARTVALREADLVLTTYGTLRRDASDFREIEFDHAVLDEAQAIKNAATSTARAARLVRARHRLVMTGTPIENRLEDLWSLFEFLNPGMLGAAPAFARLVRAGREGERSLVARGVRPLLLRRTKAQVAPELPARTEQTVWVELAPEERRLYDELRDHYRASLLARVERDGMGASRMHVLEALLRLRQAACHPGLVDRARAGAASSKLDVLADRLGEVVAEGHKALVFSQFTTLLGIVRARLDADGVPYEYLDGRTRDRQRRILRFQEDPAVPVFLVSLKAGGVGLNLTAADHVFLLDPWWNPAVEAQAIDRAHRIGQDRPVLAQRLVARDTVEEKVLALQHGKRELAEAIVRADAGVVGRLSVEELRELLG